MKKTDNGKRRSPDPAKNPGPNKNVNVQQLNRTAKECNPKSGPQLKKGHAQMTTIAESIPKRIICGDSEGNRTDQLTHSGQLANSEELRTPLSEAAVKVILANLPRLIFEITSKTDVWALAKGHWPEHDSYGGVLHCPWCKDPDSFVWIDSGYFHCSNEIRRCVSGADVIDFWRKVKNTDYLTAISQLAERMEIPLEVKKDEKGFPEAYREISARTKNDEIMTLTEVSQRWSCTRQAVRFLARQGILPWIRLLEDGSKSPKIVFPESAVIRVEKYHTLMRWIKYYDACMSFLGGHPCTIAEGLDLLMSANTSFLAPAKAKAENN